MEAISIELNPLAFDVVWEMSGEMVGECSQRIHSSKGGKALPTVPWASHGPYTVEIAGGTPLLGRSGHGWVRLAEESYCLGIG